MTRFRTLQDLFRRYRRPGDLVFAAGFFALSLFLLASIPWQVSWVARTDLVAQPAFWPVVAVAAMTLFSLLHLIGALVSERIPGRLTEVIAWARALEFAGWFLVYVAAVPRLGYLPSTVLFACLLAFRLGYRTWRWMGAATLFAVAVVVIFRSLLQVKLPAGALYEALPAGAIRSFFLVYL